MSNSNNKKIYPQKYVPKVQAIKPVYSPITSNNKPPASDEEMVLEKKLVSEILHIPNDDKWNVEDELDLYPGIDNTTKPLKIRLVNYDETKCSRDDLETLKSIRGAMVDLISRRVVSDGLGFNPTIVCSEIPKDIDPDDVDPADYLGELEATDVVPDIVPDIDISEKIRMDKEEKDFYKSEIDKGDVILTDINRKEIPFDFNKCNITKGCEGITVRVGKIGGHIIFSTYKKINAFNSMWNGRSLISLWNELGGPDVNSFFGNVYDSSFCYIFIISHEMLWLSERNNEKGAIYFLNHKRLPSITGSVSGANSENETVWTPEGSKYIKALPKMSIKEANNYLQFGGHLELFNKVFPHLKGVIEGSGVMNAESKVGVPDNMIENQFIPGFYNSDQMVDPQNYFIGGFVVVTKLNSFGAPMMSYRIESPGYHYRTLINGNNPNLVYRLFELLDYSNEKKKGMLDYDMLFPNLEQIGSMNIPSVFYPGKIGPGVVLNKMDKNIKINNIFYTYLMCIPLHRQMEVYEAIRDIPKNRKLLIEKLIKLSTAGDMSKITNEKIAKRITQILNLAKTGNREFHINLTNIINRENFDSLYRLFKWVSNDE